MFQHWTHLLFLHWRWDADDLQRRLPAGLTVDTFEGSAWLGLVPFFMRDIRPRFCPCVPWISNFLELNVRTYVFDEQGRPGVFFFSLGCNQPLAVWTARTFFHLNYRHARMKARLSNSGHTVDYACQRRGDDVNAAFRYTLHAESNPAEPGTLEFFLVERYLLFTQTPCGLLCGQVHHVPYPVSEAKVERHDTRPFLLDGFAEPANPPDHICGSLGVKVDIHPLR